MTDHVIWNELGLLHYSDGAFPQAIQAYENSIRKNGEFLPAWLNLARAYARNGDLSKAEKTYFDCLEIEMQSLEQAEVWTQLGQLYAQAGSPDASQDAYLKAESLRAPTKMETDPAEVVFDPVDISERQLDAEVASECTSVDPGRLKFAQIKTENIYINPRQPRIRIDIQALVESVREHGVIQPIIVSPGDEVENYNLISGHRRLEAARQVGLETIPAIIRDADDRERLELALTENLQRQNLSSLEQADAYAQLRDEFALTPEEIARRMGKSSITVQNLLRQLMLPERIKRALDAGRIEDGHARAILKLDDSAKQLNAFEQILLRDLSVRKTEALIRLLSVEIQHDFELTKDESQGKEKNDPPTESVALVSGDVSDNELDDHNPDLAVSVPHQEDSLVAELFPNIETATSGESDELASTANDSTSQPDANVLDNDEQLGVDEQFPGVEPGDEMFLNEDIADELPSEDESLEVGFEKRNPSPPPEEEVRLKIVSGENVVAQNPGNEEAWRNLAEHYSFLGENRKAIEAYQKALELSPQNGSYAEKIGYLYLAVEQYTQAVDAFEKALAQDDKDIYVHCALASSYRRLGMADQAQVHIDFVKPKMVKESPYNHACFESICGNVVQAIELLQVALDINEATVQKIEKDRDFDFIRQEELFVAFLRERGSKG